MEQILYKDKNIAVIAMEEYLELLKMKDEILKEEKIITFEIEKDPYHTNTIKFAYITKDEAINEISNKNNNLYDEITNLRNIIKSNNDKFNIIESQNRDLNAILNLYKSNNCELSDEIEKTKYYIDDINKKSYQLVNKLNVAERKLTLLKEMNIFQFLKLKFNKNKTK